MTKGMSAVQKEFLYRKLNEELTAMDLEEMHARFGQDPELPAIKLRNKYTKAVINMTVELIMDTEED
jgi:hypothetical protein